LTTVDQQLAAWREAFNAELDRSLTAERTGAPEPLLAAMRHAALAGGKRLRPLLIMAAAQGCGTDPETGLPAALAVEMIHTYSLIHDDLPSMDDDELRRGRPTCHVVYGEATAILAGDALQTYAFETLAAAPLPPDRVCRQVATLARATGSAGMTGGQVLDLQAEGAERVETSLVERIHKMKTGALIAACLRLGAEAAGKDPRTADQLERVGLKIGLAFQIKDDVLDCTSTADALGKTVGKDLGHNKATWPAVVGLEEAERHAEQLAVAALEELAFLDGEVEPLRRLVERAVDRAS
jgi:geranylgeranyl pyrophosphate synthase